ncbi:MAG TPA: hypothetical protein DDW42_01670 [Desulfobacteraceae bacterium]|nr:hypothetical protein [Desulfobacteraceae bacterium]
MGEFCELAVGGDIKSIWDPRNDKEVEAAEGQFKKLRKSGFKAFKVRKTGKKGKEITSFDRNAGKIIMVPEMVGG